MLFLNYVLRVQDKNIELIMTFLILPLLTFKNMKKKEEKRPAPKKVKKVVEPTFPPNHFQTIKGVQYVRPCTMQSTPSGQMVAPDVDGYPDID